MKKIALLLVCLFITIFGCKAYSAQHYIDIGKQHLSDKKFPQAKYSFIKAIKSDPNNIDAYGFAGLAAKFNRDYEEAIAYFNKAAEIDPNDYRVYGDIGDISRKLKNYDLAINAYKKVLEINPNEFRALNRLAEIYYITQDYENCQAYLDRFEKAVATANPALLSEKTKQYIEKAKLKHFNYKTTIAN